MSDVANKIAFGYATSDYPCSNNGAAVQLNTGIGAAPAVNSLIIGKGNLYAFGAPINGHFKQITYYPRRLTNAELQAITS
jgi:hypothetical protein